MILFWKIFILELVIALNSLYDAHRIDKDKPIYHGWELIVRGVIITILALSFNGPLIESLKLNTNAWKEILFFISLFWQFDYTLNWARQVSSIKWWHLGDAFFDKIWKGYPNRYWRLGLKIVLVVISGFILIFI